MFTLSSYIYLTVPFVIIFVYIIILQTDKILIIYLLEECKQFVLHVKSIFDKFTVKIFIFIILKVSYFKKKSVRMC